MATNIPTCLCGNCPTCRRRESVRKWKRAHPERSTEMKRRSKKTPRGRELSRIGKSKWRDRNRGRLRATVDPVKKSARNAVYKAVRSGRLVRQPCEKCGNPKSHAHHDDYTKKLDVRWLCPIHHAEADGWTKTEVAK